MSDRGLKDDGVVLVDEFNAMGRIRQWLDEEGRLRCPDCKSSNVRIVSLRDPEVIGCVHCQYQTVYLEKAGDHSIKVEIDAHEWNIGCPECGGLAMMLLGSHTTSTGIIRVQMGCQDCHKSFNMRFQGDEDFSRGGGFQNTTACWENDRHEPVQIKKAPV